jgi:hypothetical protein
VYKLESLFTGREKLLPIPSGIHVHEEEMVPEEGYWREEMPVWKLVVCPDDGGLVAAIVGHEASSRIARELVLLSFGMEPSLFNIL